MKRNIKLAYILSFLSFSYFWWSVWLLYYLRFTDNTGVGALISIQMFTSLLSEIPTGAIADLIGQKRSLLIAFFLDTIGYILMATAQSFAPLAVSIVFMNVGGAFKSGSFEALVYDSLKAMGKENEYQKVLSHIRSINSLTIIAVGIIGGFLYKLDPRLPFFVTAAFIALAMLLSLLFEEPPVKRHELTKISDSIKQVFNGFKHLFDKRFAFMAGVLLIVGGATVITYELLDDYIVVDSLQKPEYLGLAYAVLGLTGAVSSQFVHKLAKFKGNRLILAASSVALILSLVLTPIWGAIGALIFVVIRVVTIVFINNVSSVMINENTPSADRATTLSTFSMLKQLPLAFLAPVIGGLVETYTSYTTAAFVGMVTGAILIVYIGIGKVGTGIFRNFIRG